MTLQSTPSIRMSTIRAWPFQNRKTIQWGVYTILLLAFTACRPSQDKVTHTVEKKEASTTSAPSSTAQAYPIVFVTQVPVAEDKNTRLSAFANHRTSVHDVPRGGDLMLWMPDGRLRNLTQEAGLGQAGWQAEQAIAVREPSVHPSGDRILVSLLIGSPTPAAKPHKTATWQLYEVSQLASGDTPRFTKIAHQDPRYNYLSALYADDGDLIFTSDRPRTGHAHLYPQLDEYEATPSVTGIWKMHRATGKLSLLSHTPSGAFSPIIDQFGRIIYTRWDHLQQDQLADRDRDAERNGVALPFRSFNYANESAHAKKHANRNEIFPESRVGSESVYGKVSAFRNNVFRAWQIEQDGSNEETLNHIGQHELSNGYLTPSFIDDPSLSKQVSPQWHQNRVVVRNQGGLFHLREDPLQAGRFLAINARESGSFTTDSIVSISGHPQDNPEQMQVLPITEPDQGDRLKHGRFRNPLPLSDGRLVASHTSAQLPPPEDNSLPNLRLRFLVQANPYYVPDAYLTQGLHKKISWWDGQQIRHYDGLLWELEAVELRPRLRATTSAANTKESQLALPERQVFQEQGVDEARLRDWLIQNKLALIITRNQTKRDRADRQQPFNLRVPNGTQTLASDAPSSPKPRIYDIAYFQILQAEQIRAYADRRGRRHLAQTIPSFHPLNLTTPSQPLNPPSAVAIEKDGSTAAFVPAERALTWQTTDAQGHAVVRERNWISFKSGEIRTCAACHGINHRDQANLPPPENPPLALRTLLQNWKNQTTAWQKSSITSKTPTSQPK